MIAADIFFGVARAGEVVVGTALYLGPGLLVAAAGWSCRCTWRRLRAAAAQREVERTEFNELLRARLADAGPRVETLPGAIDATYLQLEGMYAAPDHTREGDR
ncbi:hypothetical protein AB0I93_26960 [Streptomyces sp. NPDC049967]|uniref:hypothetical protein n=1 Tax=Streptomyces sp. NPDC049967 TaxID=3155658 RepID=UPI00343FDAEF